MDEDRKEDIKDNNGVNEITNMLSSSSIQKMYFLCENCVQS